MVFSQNMPFDCQTDLAAILDFEEIIDHILSYDV